VNVPPEALHDSDTFRRSRFYKRDVHDVIERNEVMLHTIFEFYATGQPTGKMDDVGSARWLLLSLDEWLQLCTDSELYDDDFSVEKSILCFKWAQMHVTDEVKRSEKMLQLTYVDFLEALARVCCFKPLPDPNLLKAHNARSVGHFFQQAKDGMHAGVALLRRPLHWQAEESSSEPLRSSLDALFSFVLEKLTQTEMQLVTRKELHSRLVMTQKKRNRMRALQAQQLNTTNRPQTSRNNVLAHILSLSILHTSSH